MARLDARPWLGLQLDSRPGHFDASRRLADAALASCQAWPVFAGPKKTATELASSLSPLIQSTTDHVPHRQTQANERVSAHGEQRPQSASLTRH